MSFVTKDIFAFPNPYDPAQNPNIPPGLARYITNLQNIIIQQQETINNLLKQQNKEANPQAQKESTPIEKSPANGEINLKLEEKFEPDSLVQNNRKGISTTSLEQDEEHSEDEAEENMPKILKKSISKKQKKEKNNQQKIPPPPAKHLWINYGRKIVEYALTVTEGEMQNRIRQYVGKLASKKDFSDVFGIKPDEPVEVEKFKAKFGEIAITFLREKVQEAFEGSKYKDQMRNQKYVVRAWLEKCIGK